MQNLESIVPIRVSVPIDDNPTAATGTITSSGVNVSNNDTVTINSRVYTFKTTLTGAVDEVLIGANSDASLTNLRTLINSGRAAVAAFTTLTSTGVNVTAADTVTIGAKTYTFKTALTEVKALGTLTSDNTNPTAGDTVTIDTVVYTFVSSLNTTVGRIARPSRVPNQVLIGADADTTLTNLAAAINKTTGEGALYSQNTVIHPTVTAGAVIAHAIIVTSKVVGTGSNSIATTETSSHLSWGGATLASGANSVANEVLRGADAATSLANLKAAVNGAAGAGTTYSTATVASTEVTGGTLTATTLLLTAITAGTAGNALASTKSAATLSFTSTVFAGGVALNSANAAVTCSAVVANVVTLTAIDTSILGNAITLTKVAVTLSVSGATLTGAGSTIGTATLPEIGGVLRTISTNAPNWTGTPTFTIALKNSLGEQYYISGNITENTATLTDLGDINVTPGDTITVTTSTKVEESLPLVIQLR